MESHAYPSMTNRIVIAKLFGLAIGILAFWSAPQVLPQLEWTERLGLLLWYPTIGAFIGLFGVFSWHPIIALRLPWWVRGPSIGAWMNLLLAFFSPNTAAFFLAKIFDVSQTPLLSTVEGAIFGGVVAFLATKFGGEGPATIAELKSEALD